MASCCAVSVGWFVADKKDSENVIPIAMRDCGASVSTDTMEKFIASFERSSKRWELVVYPALFAFMILAAYGFYLVFSLTHDMHVIAKSIGNNIGIHIESLASNMNGMSKDVSSLTEQVASMNGNVEVMANRMDSLETLEPMLAEIRKLDTSISRLDTSVANMSVTTDLIRHDMRVMTHNVAKPMSIMNKFIP